jgi:hypothetical protein
VQDCFFSDWETHGLVLMPTAYLCGERGVLFASQIIGLQSLWLVIDGFLLVSMSPKPIFSLDRGIGGRVESVNLDLRVERSHSKFKFHLTAVTTTFALALILLLSYKPRMGGRGCASVAALHNKHERFKRWGSQCGRPTLVYKEPNKDT